MKKFNLFLLMSLIFGALVFNSCNEEPFTVPVTDIDGNVYKTVVIGNQEWFAENLRTTRYNDGTAIPTGHSDYDWATLTTGAYAVYPYSLIDGLNSDQKVLDAYGALYNWHAVYTGKLCPKGWHVPTNAEWETLITYAGGTDVAGGKLKSTRTVPVAHPRWNMPNKGATDEYGFSALPGGYRNYNGTFSNVGDYGSWWSSTETDADYAWLRRMYCSYSSVYMGSTDYEEVGFSVRCLRDK